MFNSVAFFQIFFSILMIVVSVVVTFFATKYGLHKKIEKNKSDIELKAKDIENHFTKEIYELRLILKEHKSKDDLQQQIIEQLGSQVDKLLKDLVKALEARNG